MHPFIEGADGAASAPRTAGADSKDTSKPEARVEKPAASTDGNKTPKTEPIACPGGTLFAQCAGVFVLVFYALPIVVLVLAGSATFNTITNVNQANEALQANTAALNAATRWKACRKLSSRCRSKPQLLVRALLLKCCFDIVLQSHTLIQAK